MGRRSVLTTTLYTMAGTFCPAPISIATSALGASRTDARWSKYALTILSPPPPPLAPSMSNRLGSSTGTAQTLADDADRTNPGNVFDANYNSLLPRTVLRHPTLSLQMPSIASSFRVVGELTACYSMYRSKQSKMQSSEGSHTSSSPRRLSTINPSEATALQPRPTSSVSSTP